MSAAHVVLVTEGGADVGLGHVSRCLAIARAARAEGARVSFITAPEPRVAALLGGVGAEVVSQSWPADLTGALDALRGLAPDAVVVDSYKATPTLFRALRPLGVSVVAVDDTAERALPVDAVVNGSIAAESLPYRRTAETTFLLGARYALLDPVYAGSPDRPDAGPSGARPREPGRRPHHTGRPRGRARGRRGARRRHRGRGGGVVRRRSAGARRARARGAESRRHPSRPLRPPRA